MLNQKPMMQHYCPLKIVWVFNLFLCFTLSAWSQNTTLSETVVVTGRKITKKEAQLNAQKAIDAQRLVVATQKGLVNAKANEIDRKQRAFDARRARYLAEEERIKHKDAVVATRESCLANLLADCLSQCGPQIMSDYQGFRNHPNEEKKIGDFKFSQSLARTLRPAYYLAYQEYISTFMDSKGNRAAFDNYVKENFPQYFMGGKDRNNNKVEGIFSKHFHPKNLGVAHDESSPIAQKYLDELGKLLAAQSQAMRIATAMPPEFFLGWQRFEQECGLPVTYTLKGERKKERIPEVQRQEKEGQALRMDYLHLQDLKEEKRILDGELVGMESQLQLLVDDYFKKYKTQY